MTANEFRSLLDYGVTIEYYVILEGVPQRRVTLTIKDDTYLHYFKTMPDSEYELHQFKIINNDNL